MPTLSFHTSEETDRIVRILARQQGIGPSALVSQVVEEGLRMRRFPGIVFRDGPTGRRVGIAGSLDIWEVIEILRDFADDDKAVLAVYPSLTASALRTSRAYYAVYPQEIDTRIEMNTQPEKESSNSFPSLFASPSPRKHSRLAKRKRRIRQRA
jgi:hypothetical protein